jgi:hypothetical protein
LATIRSRISKGRQFQKRVMLAVKEAFHLTNDDIRTAVGAETGEDIKLSASARKVVGLSIECKDVKSLNIFKAIEQAKKNCPEGCVEAVVFKRGDMGSHKTYICLPFASYLALRQVPA